MRVFKGNLSPTVFQVIKIDNKPFDLTDCTVKFRMRPEGSSDLLVDEDAERIVPYEDGAVKYEWQEGDTDRPGKYFAWWTVDLTATGPQDTPEFAIEIREHGTSSELPYVPTVSDVADLLQARTRDANANLVGTFTDSTKPTHFQVLDLIDQAAEVVSLAIGTNIPEALLKQARDVVAIRAAMMVELNFYPEQIGSDQSAYPYLERQYDEMIGLTDPRTARRLPGLLVLAVQQATEDQTVDVLGAGMPKGHFPKIRKLRW